MIDKLYTLTEAADFLGLSDDEVCRLVDGGEIPAYQVGGKYLRFKEEQLILFKDRQLKNPALPAEKVVRDSPGKESFISKVFDFLYFSDFYIISAILIALLVFIILKSIR
jgi:excisionase family DNA binding protein